MRPGVISAVLAATVGSSLAQVMISAGPDLNFTASVNGPFTTVSTITIGAAALGGPPVSVGFQYTGVTPVNAAQPTPPNFLVVTPSTGATSSSSDPAEVFIGLNPAVVKTMAPGAYSLYVNFSTVNQTPAATTHIMAVLALSPPGMPSVTSVVNAASFQPGLAPGALVSIFGSDFGPAVMATQYDDNGLYPTAVLAGSGNTAFGDTTVTFGGIAAPLTYLSGSQINAIVPNGVAGVKAVDVVVTCYKLSSAAFSIPILDTSPAIFTATQNGTGQGAILNVNPNNPNAPGAITYNSASNPAPRGFAVVMYATGAGAWNPPVPDGEIALTAIYQTGCVTPYRLECSQLANQPLSLTIGGKPATVFYAGTALYLPWSLLQINAYVPDDAPSGQQPVVLKVGQNDNSQQGVTVAIQ